MLSASAALNTNGTLTDAAIFMLLVVSVLVDMCRLFPTWLGDRLAFIGYLAAISEGFKGSGAFETIRSGIEEIAKAPQGLWDIPLTRGAAQVGPQIFAAVIFLITLGAMAPVRWQKWLGTFAQIAFADFRGMFGARGVRGANSPVAMVKPPAGMPPQIMVKSWFRSLFPGTVNLGMVALVFLLIVSASMAGSGIAGWINNAIQADVHLAGNLVGPLMGRVS